jgi:small subunit ribosomal protein S16
MVTIRLFRFGTKNRPTYRVCVSDKHKDTKGKYIEAVGHYNPQSNPKVISLKRERIEYWLSVGAQASATVKNLFISQGLIPGPKVKAFSAKKKGEKKTT